MNEFLEIALSFPTVILSGMLICAVMYWLMVIVGAVDLDMIDLDLDLDLDVDVDVDADVDVDPEIDVDIAHGGILHAVMATIGLGRVPVSIIGSILTLIAWFLCFSAVYYLGPILGTGVFVGLAMVLASLIVSLPITTIFTHPLKDVFEIHTRTGGHTLVGKLCKVTSGRVSDSFGQAAVDDGGAGLLVSIRSDAPGALVRGSKALIIDYDEDEDLYFVEPFEDLLSEKDEDADEVVFEENQAEHDAAAEEIVPKSQPIE